MSKGKQLAAILERIRQKKVCAYLDAMRCHCKYGGEQAGQTFGESGNGCPEMRNAIAILERLTDKEIDRTLKRKPAVGFFHV